MGLFKNFKSDRADAKVLRDSVLGARKDALAMAEQMQTQYAGGIQAAQSMDLGKQMAMAQRVQGIFAGEVGTGTVVSARDLGTGESGNGTSVEIVLALVTGPGAPRQLTFRQDVMGTAATLTPGLEITVKIDPAHPDNAMMWAEAPTGSDARVAKLEQLAAMHAAGAFTDEEFAAKKAAVLAED